MTDMDGIPNWSNASPWRGFISRVLSRHSINEGIRQTQRQVPAHSDYYSGMCKEKEKLPREEDGDKKQTNSMEEIQNDRANTWRMETDDDDDDDVSHLHLCP